MGMRFSHRCGTLILGEKMSLAARSALGLGLLSLMGRYQSEILSVFVLWVLQLPIALRREIAQWMTMGGARLSDKYVMKTVSTILKKVHFLAVINLQVIDAACVNAWPRVTARIE